MNYNKIIITDKKIIIVVNGMTSELCDFEPLLPVSLDEIRKPSADTFSHSSIKKCFNS